MTESSQKKFVDRRSEEEIKHGLATNSIWWYDLDEKGRRRCNGIAITTDRFLVVGRASCSRRDQFNRKRGRQIVTGRILSLANVEVLPMEMEIDGVRSCAEVAADTYRAMFDDDKGLGRAYNVGKILDSYLNWLDNETQDL